jgi:hypothetical protein
VPAKKPAQVAKSPDGFGVWEVEHDMRVRLPKRRRPDWIWQVEQVNSAVEGDPTRAAPDGENQERVSRATPGGSS